MAEIGEIGTGIERGDKERHEIVIGGKKGKEEGVDPGMIAADVVREAAGEGFHRDQACTITGDKRTETLV